MLYWSAQLFVVAHPCIVPTAACFTMDRLMQDLQLVADGANPQHAADEADEQALAIADIQKKPAAAPKQAPAALIMQRPASSTTQLKRPAAALTVAVATTQDDEDSEALRTRVKSRKFFDMWDEIPSHVKECYEEAN